MNEEKLRELLHKIRKQTKGMIYLKEEEIDKIFEKE